MEADGIITINVEDAQSILAPFKRRWEKADDLVKMDIIDGAVGYLDEKGYYIDHERPHRYIVEHMVFGNAGQKP